MKDYTSNLFRKAQGSGRGPVNNPLKAEAKITQAFRGYWDADEANMVVEFRFHGQTFCANFCFDRTTRALRDVDYTVGEEVKSCTLPTGVDYKALEAAARKEF